MFLLLIIIIISEEYQEQFELLEPGTPTETFIATLGLLEWNERQLQGFYDSVYTNDPQIAECTVGDDYVRY